MPETAFTSAPASGNSSSANSPSSEVYAVFGAEPEVQAYAMAKYSRSALSMKESLKEISAQKAEKFLNTFYFQYGHRSIADLAHAATTHRISAQMREQANSTGEPLTVFFRSMNRFRKRCSAISQRLRPNLRK